MAPNSFQIFSEKVDLLGEVIKKIPTSIAVAAKTDTIFVMFQKIPIPSHTSGQYFEVFNRYMDILFGEDVQDKTTRHLINVKCGPFGMDMVFKYITKATNSGLLVWDLAQIKVDRLITEIEKIW